LVFSPLEQSVERQDWWDICQQRKCNQIDNSWSSNTTLCYLQSFCV